MSDELTVKKILDADQLKWLADMIVGEEIDNIVIVYRDKKNHFIDWATTLCDYPTILGELSLADDMIRQEIWRPHSETDEV